MNIHVPHYDKKFVFEWEAGFLLRCTVQQDSVLREGNKEGFISLARHLLELAQDEVPGRTGDGSETHRGRFCVLT